MNTLGYGFRVPCLVISPHAKQGVTDHVQGDFASLVKFAETVYSLQPPSSRDAAASNMMEALDFALVPRAPLVLPGPSVADHHPLITSSGETTTTSTTAAKPSTTTTTPQRIAGTIVSSTKQQNLGVQVGGVFLLPSVVAGASVAAALLLSAMKRRAGMKGAEHPLR